MTIQPTDEQRTCSSSTIHLIVDGNDLYLSQRALLGRAPGSDDCIGYGEIEALAERWGLRIGRRNPQLQRDFFDIERGSDRDSNPFYLVMEHTGYQLHLTPRSQAAAVVRDRLLDRFEQLSQCRCPIFYVGGAHNAMVLQRVLALNEQRQIAVAHFEQETGFEAHHSLTTADLVDEIGAAGRHYYAEPASAQSAAEDDQAADEHGALGTALAECGIAPDEFPQPEDDGAAAEPLLMLIDMENIDSTLHDILRGSGLELNAETRPSWTRLLDWAAQERGRGSVVAIPVLQDGDGLSDKSGFAVELRQRGYRPLLVQSEPGRPVVDQAIGKLLTEMQEREGEIVLISNDGGYYLALEALRRLPGGGDRQISVAGFVDQMSQEYRRADWIRTLDLERDLELFDSPLPNRHLAVAVDEFDAAALLDESGLFPQSEQ